MDSARSTTVPFGRLAARALAIAAALGLALIAGCGGERSEDASAMNAAGAGASSTAGAGAGGSATGAGGSAGTMRSATTAGSGGMTTAVGSGTGGSAPSVAGMPAAGASGASAGSGGAPGQSGAGGNGGAGGSTTQGPRFPTVTSTAMAGPFETVQDLSSGPRGASGLFRPKTLGENGLRHPIFVWGCGGGSNPTSYADQMERIASHGFVVIAEVSAIGDDGAPLLAAFDWLAAESMRQGSELYQKLDTTKAAVGGHSIGSVNSFLVAPDPRWTTTIHVAGGSLDNVNDPFAPTTGKGGKSLVHPVAYICAETDSFGNTDKTEMDYTNTTVPVFFTVIDGAEHVGAAREGLPVTVAWLRWQLMGETERRSAFLDPQGEFCTGKFVSRSKNW